MAICNPYAGINWATYEKIVSVTHAHAKNQEQFDPLYTGGVRHMAISNYYASEPFYPVVNGQISGIESAETVTVPADCVPCPNAEHHNMTVNNLHMCTVGSFFKSGTPEVINPDGSTDRSGTPRSMGGRSWKVLIKSAVPELQFEDGGGLTINHPAWSELSMKNIFSILDYTPYVLGIEACNTDLEGDLQYWDAVLATGRRAWGFFVPDHKHKNQPDGNWRGRNVLLVPEKTEEECLKAYRNGHFFGRLWNTDLSFTGITLNGRTVTYSTNGADSITVIEDGNRTTYQGSTCTHTAAVGAVYVRAEASTAENTIYSQAITFNLFTPRRQDTWDFEKANNVFRIQRMKWY